MSLSVWYKEDLAGTLRSLYWVSTQVRQDVAWIAGFRCALACVALAFGFMPGKSLGDVLGGRVESRN